MRTQSTQILRSTRGALAGAAALVLSMLVWGCAMDSDSAETTGGVYADCYYSGCPSGYACSFDGCIESGSAETVSIALVVDPSNNTNLLKQQFRDLIIQAQSGASFSLGDLILEPSTRLDGRVYVVRDEEQVPARATLSFRLLGSVDQAVVTLETNGEIDDFELVPGTYQVTARPEDGPVPAFRVDELTVRGGDFYFEIPLPSVDDYFQVEGLVARQRPSDLEAVPIASASVTLVSPTTGLVLSTEGRTDSEGRFSVLVQPTARDYAVRLGPTDENPLVPELATTAVMIDEPTDLGTLIVGEWADPVEVSGWVSGVNGEPHPVENATVIFEQDLELGTFTNFAQADADGTYLLTLIPGTYDVIAVPPSDAVYGAATFAETIVEATTQPFELRPKPVLSGTITGANGAPVEGAVVTAQPTGSDRDSVLDSTQVETDEDGHYSLPVHPGTQRITVDPPSMTGLSPLVREGVTVAEDVELRLTLEDARGIAGRVLAPDGTPIAQARVQAYFYLPGADSPRRFASVETDDDGVFVVTLPTDGF